MSAKRNRIPQYGTAQINGHTYYKTMITDIEGNRICLFSKPRAELYDKEMEVWAQIENDKFRSNSPTVADYTSKVNRHIVSPLGDRRIAEIALDDIQMALIPVSQLSASVYKSVVVLFKAIFRSAKDNRIILGDPTIHLSAKGGGIPQSEKTAPTDNQAKQLLDAVRDLPPYVFVILGLYAGLRREEILALKWDSVYLDTDAPFLTVRRAWHTEHNRPVILNELKTNAAARNIPLPDCLAKCLRETMAKSNSEYVIANSDGDPLSNTQFKRLWQYVTTRTTKERSYYRYENGTRVKHTGTPALREKAAHNDFDVTSHLLRHAYITNLLYAGVDPKTVQYLAGHKTSKTTMDIYAQIKYNQLEQLYGVVNAVFM